jgi:integrase
MLLRCDVHLEEALHLRRDDVRLEEATIYFPGTENRGSRTVSLPTTLHEGFQDHVQRVEDRTTAPNPHLFGPYEPAARSAPAADSGTDAELDRSTKLATRVMRTFAERRDAGDDSA